VLSVRLSELIQSTTSLIFISDKSTGLPDNIFYKILWQTMALKGIKIDKLLSAITVNRIVTTIF